MSAPPPGPPPPGALPPVPPFIGAIVGSQLIGSLLNFCLYGVLAVQVYIYRLAFPNDNMKIKALVYFAFIFETAQTVLNGIDNFDWFAKGFGNVLVIASPGLGPIYTPIMSSIMALVVQVFFCYRIWIINKNARWVSALAGAISIIQAVAGFIGGVRSAIQDNVKESIGGKTSLTLVYLWLVGDAVVDVIIAAAMTFLLTRGRRGLHRGTGDAVSKIVRLTIETNAFSAVVAVVSLILFAGVPGTTYFICPTLILGKLYANTLLVTFNNRAFIHKKAETGYSSNYSAPQTGTWNAATRSQTASVPFSAGLRLEEGDSYNNTIPISVMSHTVTDTTVSNTLVLSKGDQSMGGYNDQSPTGMTHGRYKPQH